MSEHVMQRAAGARECLDEAVPVADREASLADVARLNAWFGGHRLTLRALGRLARRAPSERPMVIVDLGGGRGDFARCAARWAQRRRLAARLIVVDRAPEGGRAGDGIRRVVADATALPFREGAVDVVTASLLLHHLEPAAAARCLGEMAFAARLGFVVNDLSRTRLTLVLVWLATRLVARHRFSRHDGPLSVRRAYRPREMRALAHRAGLHRLAVREYPLLGRVVAVAERARHTPAGVSERAR